MLPSQRVKYRIRCMLTISVGIISGIISVIQFVFFFMETNEKSMIQIFCTYNGEYSNIAKHKYNLIVVHVARKV